MKPTKFKEANLELKRPSSMTDEECGSLWVHSDGDQLISCWKLTFWEKVSIILNGKVWLGVMGSSQPPVWLDARSTVFTKPKKG